MYQEDIDEEIPEPDPDALWFYVECPRCAFEFFVSEFLGKQSTPVEQDSSFECFCPKCNSKITRIVKYTRRGIINFLEFPIDGEK